MFKLNNMIKLFVTVLICSYLNLAFASYASRTKEVDQLIQKNMETIKSTERLDIPEYKGDTLTFQRLSKVRNVFNIDHLLPFEKRKPVVKSNKKKAPKQKPITVPKKLQLLMDKKPTKLQQYPLNSFKFKGAVYQNNDKWGVVENSMEKKPLYLVEGQLIGKDYGHISNVTKKGIVISEWKKNKQKRVWQETQTVIH